MMSSHPDPKPYRFHVGVEAVVPHLHNLVVGVACLGQGHDLILLQGSGTLVIPILRGARAELSSRVKAKVLSCCHCNVQQMT